jgi:hypothetical protein
VFSFELLFLKIELVGLSPVSHHFTIGNSGNVMMGARITGQIGDRENQLIFNSLWEI